MNEVKKIVVIGPESTGKSTLCAQLANHYNTTWCAEYARDYLLTYGKTYNYETLLTIAKGQLKLEEDATNRALQPLVFVDTDMYVMKVWCEYVFGKCHSFILEQIAERNYTLYLFCNIDLPWVEDELREYPDEKSRHELYEIYKDILVNQHTPWVEISGTDDERLQKAIAVVDSYLEK